MTILKLIRASGHRNDYVARKLGISLLNFNVKIKKNNFSENEVQRIISIVKNEKVEDYIMLEVMIAKKEESVISLEQLEKEMNW